MEKEEEIVLDRLCSGDRPSIIAMGMSIAHSLKVTKPSIAVIMVDVLGRVVLMPPGSIKILTTPKLTDDDLDGFDGDRAIEIMVKEERLEEDIISYLRNRKARGK